MLKSDNCLIYIASCSSLTNPNNGTINCLLGDDGVPSYEDTCTFTCNTGYELTGSSEGTCQSDGNWSNLGVMCREGIARHITTYITNFGKSCM